MNDRVGRERIVNDRVRRERIVNDKVGQGEEPLPCFFETWGWIEYLVFDTWDTYPVFERGRADFAYF